MYLKCLILNLYNSGFVTVTCVSSTFVVGVLFFTGGDIHAPLWGCVCAILEHTGVNNLMLADQRLSFIHICVHFMTASLLNVQIFYFYIYADIISIDQYQKINICFTS